jgi:hypothetical protein
MWFVGIVDVDHTIGGTGECNANIWRDQVQAARLRTIVGVHAIETRCRMPYEMREIIEDCGLCTSRDVLCAVDGFATCNAGPVTSHVSAAGTVKYTRTRNADPMLRGVIVDEASFPRIGTPKNL